MKKIINKYQLLFQTFWVLAVWYAINVIFHFEWTSAFSALWNKLNFFDSYMIDSFLTVIASLLVFLTGTQPFLWSKQRSKIVVNDFAGNKKKALIFYAVIIIIYFSVLLIITKPDLEFLSHTINNYYTYTQIPYYLSIALASVLFDCGLAYRAFAEETKIHFVVYSLIISLSVSLFFLLYTYSVRIFILQFLLQLSTLIVFNFYPSIWLAISYETVMMYLSFIFG